MTLGQFKDKIEELEKAGKVTDDFELTTDTEYGDELVTSIEVINSQYIRFNLD